MKRVAHGEPKRKGRDGIPAFFSFDLPKWLLTKKIHVTLSLFQNECGDMPHCTIISLR